MPGFRPTLPSHAATGTGVAAAPAAVGGAAFEDGEGGGGQAQEAALFSNDTLLPAVSNATTDARGCPLCG